MLFRHLALLLAAALPLSAAELRFDWTQFALDRAPTGFVGAVSGEGRPGDWRVVLDDVPPVLRSFNENAPVPRRPVLAQVARTTIDEHYPVLVYQGETFQDFTLKTRFKTTSGEVAQMAGVVFRYQNERNYYVVRASTAGKNVRFYKFVDGQRTQPIGPEVAISPGVWHSLTVECRGNRIRVLVDDREIMPELTDNSFAFGKVGFWTKSDSVAHFADSVITYKPRESAAAIAVREMVGDRRSLLGLRLYRFKDGDTNAVTIVASSTPEEVGRAAGRNEADTLLRGTVYYGKSPERVEVTLPIRDRNGEIAAAARLSMTTFKGQTEENAIGRATPIRKELEMRLQSADDWE